MSVARENLKFNLIQFNNLFCFKIIIPFYSKVSFSALFRLKPFYPDMEINPNTVRIYST